MKDVNYGEIARLCRTLADTLDEFAGLEEKNIEPTEEQVALLVYRAAVLGSAFGELG